MSQDGPAKIRVEPLARRDFGSTRGFYERENPRLAQDFAAAFDHALATIAEAPHRWAMFEPGVRRLLLSRFPVSIYYRLENDDVQILRVVDQRRQPGAWRRP